jgi:membrane protein implicated in regulation of membrane protease activity
MRWLHALARRLDRIVCWAIGAETLGGLLYYAIRAQAFTAVALLLLLATIGWKTTRRRRRRVTRTRQPPRSQSRRTP